jgi:hypothetical protein
LLQILKKDEFKMKTSDTQNSWKNRNFGFFTKYIFFFLFLIFYFPQQTISQNDFRPGFIVTLENDTIQGFVDYRGDLKNSRYCTFKKNKESAHVQYNPRDIKAYKFTDSKYYVSKKIAIEQQQDHVFLEFLVDGIVNLYYYADINNSQYFIEDRSGNLHKLTNEASDEYLKDIGYVRINSKRYIGLLKATFADCLEIQPEIERVHLNHKSLINIAKNYHNYVCDGEKCIVYQKPVPKLSVKIAPVVGGNASFLRFNEGLYSNFEFDQNYFPFMGVFLDAVLPRFNEKLSLEIESTLNKPSFYGRFFDNSGITTDYYQANINVFLMQSSASLKYTFPRNKIRPTFAIGLSSNIFLSKDQKTIKESVFNQVVHTYETFDPPLTSNLYGLLLQVGFNYILPSQRTIFTKLRVSHLSNRESDSRSIIQAAGISLGMFLSNPANNL